MPVFYTCSEPETGRIVYYGRGNSVDDAQQEAVSGYDFNIVPEAANPRTHYIENGLLTYRPHITVANANIDVGVEELLAEDFPTGTTVRIDNIYIGELTDGDFHFTADEIGKYEIELTPPFPWLPTDFEVIAE